MKRRDRTVMHEIECGPASIEIEARVSPPVAAEGFDAGDGGEVEIISATRFVFDESRPECWTRVPINLDALLSVIGPAAWAAIEEACFEQAADQDDGPDPDAARDQAEDR